MAIDTTAPTVTRIVNDLGNVTFGRFTRFEAHGNTYVHITIVASDMPIERRELLQYFYWVTSVNYRIASTTQESNRLNVCLDTVFFTLDECLDELDGVLRAFVPNTEDDPETGAVE